MKIHLSVPITKINFLLLLIEITKEIYYLPVHYCNTKKHGDHTGSNYYYQNRKAILNGTKNIQWQKIDDTN